ncbi:MAG: hydrogenase maturation protease [Ilumatobacteraceae bacterium]
MSPVIALIGVGNRWRGDDGVGWAVVASAGRRLGQSVAVIEADGEPSRLIDAWTDVDLAVVVDGVTSDAKPGTIHVWQGDADLGRSSRSNGSHSLGLADAIALGRAVQRLPRQLVVVGIEVHETSSGDELSPSVVAKVEQAADLVAGIVTRWKEDPTAQAGSKATSSEAPGSSE